MSRPGEILDVMNVKCAASEKQNASLNGTANEKKREKKWDIFMMITVWRQVGEALALAPLPLAIADVEVDVHGAGYPLVPVWWDLHNKGTLKKKKKTKNTIRDFTLMR